MVKRRMMGMCCARVWRYACDRLRPHVGTTKPQLMLLEAERNVSGGMMRCALAMYGCKHSRVPASPHNSGEQRFEQRFGCFAAVARPEPPTYEHWEAVSNTTRASLM